MVTGLASNLPSQPKQNWEPHLYNNSATGWYGPCPLLQSDWVPISLSCQCSWPGCPGGTFRMELGLKRDGSSPKKNATISDSSYPWFRSFWSINASQAPTALEWLLLPIFFQLQKDVFFVSLWTSSLRLGQKSYTYFNSRHGNIISASMSVPITIFPPRIFVLWSPVNYSRWFIKSFRMLQGIFHRILIGII